MDGLKELVEAFSARIKSPIIGSIALAFVAINWQPVFFLFFSGEHAKDKFAYFTENTTGFLPYLLPVIVVLAFALLVPWINLLGAKAIELPVTKHRNMQLDAAHVLAEKKTRHAIDMETVSTEYRRILLESAKVDQEIKDADIDDDVLAGLEAKLDETRKAEAIDIPEIKEVDIPLSDISIRFLRRTAEDPSGRVSLVDQSGGYYVVFGTREVMSADQVNRQSFLEAQEITNELVKIGYMEKNGLGDLDLTTKGYAYLASLPVRKPKEEKSQLPKH